MSVFSVYVVSESGSLQFYYDHTNPTTEVEKTFNFPIPLHLKICDGRVVVDFASCDDVKVGFGILSVNSVDARDLFLEDGREILQVISDENNYPLTIKFGKPRLRSNERIKLASMLQPLQQMARLLSPVPNSKIDFISSDAGEKQTAGIWNSGIQSIETGECRIHCLESRTGVKFLLVTDFKLPPASRDSLRRIYEAYTEYVLKNPFYASNQPFHFDFFTNQVKTICEQVERGIYAA